MPTFAELGVNFESAPFYGAVAPAGVPPAVIERLHGALVKALNAPDMRARLEDLGLEPIGNSPREFAEVIRAEIPRWKRVVKASGAKVD